MRTFAVAPIAPEGDRSAVAGALGSLYATNLPHPPMILRGRPPLVTLRGEELGKPDDN
jgi:hypothetical protein